MDVERIVDPLASLIVQARHREDVDLIYVNDNHGDFTAGPFLAKVRHSGFFSTSLGYLLSRLGTRRVVITGQVTEQCVLYTALDAYVRHLDIRVPPDAVASINPALGDAALQMMQSNMRAELCDSSRCWT